MKYQPRNDFVLIKVTARDKSAHGVVLPQVSMEAKDYMVVSFGSDVKGLKAGDRVLLIGQLGMQYFPVPREQDLILIKQEGVALVIAEDE